MNAGVAIVGAGLAGLSCAVRAAQAGKEAVVLERSSEAAYPCSSRIATGVFHVAFNPPSLDAAILEERARTALGPGAREDALKAICGSATRAIEWLRQTAGARFERAGDDPAYEFVIKPSAVGKLGPEREGQGADRLLRSLEQKLVALGGRIERGRAANRLEMKNGRCIGVSGEGFEVAAEAVVLADGGYQGDLERVRQRISPGPERIVQRNARSARGDGLRMALAAGAALADRGGFYGHLQARRALEDDGLWPYPWLDDLGRAGLMVGPDAKRLGDDRATGIELANRAAALADPASAWVICDRRAWEGAGAGKPTSPNPHLERLGGKLLQAPTLAALAVAASLDGATLAKTVSACAAKFTSAPYFAIPVAPGITYTFGGIAVDGASRMLREDGRPLPGLYAAGSTTGGLEGGERAGYVGGLMKALVTGLLAAEHLCG
jgi:fumarate reductase flavoprotein subunit